MAMLEAYHICGGASAQSGISSISPEAHAFLASMSNWSVCWRNRSSTKLKVAAQYAGSLAAVTAETTHEGIQLLWCLCAVSRLTLHLFNRPQEA